MARPSNEGRMRAARAITLAFAATIALTIGATPSLACGFLEICTTDPQTDETQRSRQPKTEAWLLGAINDARAQHGAGSLTWDASLDSLATSHAKRMAAATRLFHNEAGLRARRAQTGETLGENVGLGVYLDDVHEAFLASTSHRRTMMGPYERVGLGIVRRSGEVYVVEVFASRGGYLSVAQASHSDTSTEATGSRARPRAGGEPVLVRSEAAPRPAPPMVAVQARGSSANPLLLLGGALVLLGLRRVRYLLPRKP